jgi:hypothetical protein
VLRSIGTGYGSVTFAELCKKHAAGYLKGLRERSEPGRRRKNR